jgi:hypothetical protein
MSDFASYDIIDQLIAMPSDERNDLLLSVLTAIPADERAALFQYVKERTRSSRKGVGGRPRLMPFERKLQFKVLLKIRRDLVDGGRLPNESQPASIKHVAEYCSIDARSEKDRLRRIANGKGGKDLNDAASAKYFGLRAGELMRYEDQMIGADGSHHQWELPDV